MRAPKGRLAVVADAILGVVEIGAVLDRGRVGRSLGADEIRQVRRLRAEGHSIKAIGRKLGIALNTVRRYLPERTRLALPA